MARVGHLICRLWQVVWDAARAYFLASQARQNAWNSACSVESALSLMSVVSLCGDPVSAVYSSVPDNSVALEELLDA